MAEMEEMGVKDLEGGPAKTGWMDHGERRETLDHRDLLGRGVEESPTSGGVEPPALIQRELKWCMSEGLLEVTIPILAEVPTISACQENRKTLTMVLEPLIVPSYTGQSTR